MADQYIQLHSNAIAMRAMLQLECVYALLSVDQLDDHFNMLGEQVDYSLCRISITTPTGHRLYQPQELTQALIGTHASIIWELNRTLKASRPARTNLSRLSAVVHHNQVKHCSGRRAVHVVKFHLPTLHSHP